MTLEQQSWNSVAKSLHWLIFIMLLVEVPAGYLMASLYGPGLKHADVTPLAHLLGQIHHTNGFLLLGAVFARLAWRFTHPAPALPADLSVAQRRVSRVTQALLYALLIGLPVSGWLALSVLADSPQFGKTNIWFFTIDGLVPRLIEPRPFNDPQGYAYFARFHIWFINTGAALLALHIGAALFHHFVRRDGVLRSMWPLAGRR
jgi:cytochrome b561